MSDFEPGAGWREVTAQGYVEASATTITLREDGRPDRWWVCEEPVPPLPTEPNSVIRVEWDTGHAGDWSDVLVLGVERHWAWSAVGRTGFIDRIDLPKWITGWEPVAEPRAVTAKAILDRVREEFAAHSWSRRYLDTIAGEFEVTL